MCSNVAVNAVAPLIEPSDIEAKITSVFMSLPGAAIGNESPGDMQTPGTASCVAEGRAASWGVGCMVEESGYILSGLALRRLNGLAVVVDRERHGRVAELFLH